MRNMGDRQDKNCTSLSLADARPFAGGQSDAEFYSVLGTVAIYAIYAIRPLMIQT
jgi:hypothetical protein